MEASFWGLCAVSLTALGYWHWLEHVVNTSTMSGDKWYMRHAAFTDMPVSAPYCWRPLVPFIARFTGFTLLSYSASLASPVLIYYWIGGGWRGFCCAMLFVGNLNIYHFNVRNPEYAESVGHFLMLASLWAIQTGSPLAWPLLLLSALCRETLTGALGAIVLFVNPLLLAPLMLGSAVSWFTRNEDKDNRHPLVERGIRDTVYRWAKHKGIGALSYSHVIQPLRGLAVAVPFMWGSVGDFARLGLVGFIPIWLLAIPASGQSRIMCYGFGLLVPFAAALPIEWLWVFVGLVWFWPFDLRMFDETGGVQSFGFVR